MSEAEIAEPGSYELAAEVYHADPAPVPSLSRSVAKLLLERSPLHAWHAHPRLNPGWEPESKNQTAIGSAAHKILLGAGAEIAVCEERDWRKKAAQEFREVHLAEGLIPLTLPQWEKVEEMVEAARTQLGDLIHERAGAEVAWFSEEMPAGDGQPATWLRCMTDWITPDGLTVYDYKTTATSAAPGAVWRLAMNMDWPFQQAFYQRVIFAIKPELRGRLRFLFLVQENYPPYAMVPVELTEADLTIARRQVEVAIDKWSACMARGKWPGYGREIVPVVLPEWRVRDWLDRELEDETA